MNVLLTILHFIPTLHTSINLVIHSQLMYFQSYTLSTVSSPYDTFTLNNGMLTIGDKALCHRYGSTTVNTCTIDHNDRRMLKIRMIGGCTRVGTNGMCVSVNDGMVGLRECGGVGQCALVQNVEDESDGGDKNGGSIRVGGDGGDVNSGRRYGAGYDEKGMVNLNGRDSRRRSNRKMVGDENEGSGNGGSGNGGNENSGGDEKNENSSENSTATNSEQANDANTSTVTGTSPFNSQSYDLSRVQQSLDDAFHTITKTNPEIEVNIKRVIPKCFNGYESMDEYLRDVLPNVRKMRKKYCYNEFYDIGG